MKFTGALFLALTLAAFAAAQTPADASGVAVRNFEWHPTHRDEKGSEHGLQKKDNLSRSDPLVQAERQRADASYDPQRLEMPSPAVRPSNRRHDGYESSVHLENTGTKTVTAVEWEHVFFADDEKRTEVRRRKLRKRTLIAPGEQKFVSQREGLEKKYDQYAPRNGQAVEVTRVVYSDGSVWQRR